MKVSRTHLWLAWLESTGQGNTPEIVGLRLRLACYESGRWNKKWALVSDAPPVSEIAKILKTDKASVTRLLNGARLLSDEQIEALCKNVGVDFTWVMTGRQSTGGSPAWAEEYDEWVNILSAQACMHLVPEFSKQERLRVEVPAEIKRLIGKWESGKPKRRMVSVSLPADEWYAIGLRLQGLAKMEPYFAPFAKVILDRARDSAWEPPPAVMPRRRRR